MLSCSLPAQELGVALNSQGGIISGLGSGTSNFFLERLGSSTPLLFFGKIMGPVLGIKYSKRIITGPRWSSECV